MAAQVLGGVGRGLHRWLSGDERLRVAGCAVVVAGVLVGASRAQGPVPDAQVEANVLKSLAGAPELASEQITTRTVDGVVTLSGAVSTERARNKVEQLAANTSGVVKVVDELRLGSASPDGVSAPVSAASPLVLLSDGTYGPAPASKGQVVAAPGAAQVDGQAAASAPMLQRDASRAQAAPSPGDPYPRRPMYYPGYQQQPPYPPAYGEGQQGGQVAGLPVVIPDGVLLRVRVNRMLRSDKTQPGTMFDGIVVNDVAANGVIAIPRGAAVQGTVVDARGSGTLTGRGEMSIQVTSVMLAGKSYPLISNVVAQRGGDKTIETVNKAAGFGAVGALFGALAGGGVGAAVGGGLGAAAGLGSSAISGHGQVVIPSEGVVTFHTAQPATVATVSQQEMQRLAYGVPPGADGRPAQRAYPPVYFAPGYYPGYYSYRPYGPSGPYN